MRDDQREPHRAVEKIRDDPAKWEETVLTTMLPTSLLQMAARVLT